MEFQDFVLLKTFDIFPVLRIRIILHYNKTIRFPFFEATEYGKFPAIKNKHLILVQVNVLPQLAHSHKYVLSGFCFIFIVICLVISH